jgi:ATP-binding cassette subfamily C protein CydC
MRNFMRLLSFLRPALRQVALSVLAGLATIAAGVGLMGTSAYIIAAAALHPSVADLQVAIIGVRFFGISRGLFRYAERLVSHTVNLKVLSNIRVWFYQKIEPLAPAQLEQAQSGDLLQRAMGDIETLENFYVRFVMPVLVAVVASAAASGLVSTLYPPLGWILAGGLAVNGLLLPGIVFLTSRKNARNLVQSQAAVSAEFVEFTQVLADLQVYGADQRALSQIQTNAEKHSRQVRTNAVQNSLVDAAALLVSHLTMLGALWVMFPPVYQSEFSGVLLAVAALIILTSFEATQPLPLAAQQLNSSLEAAGRIFDLVEPIHAEIKPLQELTPSEAPHSVSFENVTFQYEGMQIPALQNITLELARGRKVAVAGASGAGKSTLIRLLLRFWRPVQGSIKLDGTNINELNEVWLRRQFGVINPTTMIFNESLRENLLLANSLATEEEMLESLSAAGLMDWYRRLPDGLETSPGEMGASLSAGEKQRLGLARVILQHPPFLLLDEPISNLDVLTGMTVLEKLFQSNPEAGVLYISHDLLHLGGMDEILVLKNGVIIEQGTYMDLIAKNGTFARWVKLQSNALVET